MQEMKHESMKKVVDTFSSKEESMIKFLEVHTIKSI
jgi:hypothetical protein